MSDQGRTDDDEIKPWDSDHTALVHVLWRCHHDGLTLKDDFDEIASRIRASKYHRAVVAHAFQANTQESTDTGHGFVSQTSNACKCGLMLADCPVASRDAYLPPRQSTDHPGYCWPSLGEPCGSCHRCAEPHANDVADRAQVAPSTRDGAS